MRATRLENVVGTDIPGEESKGLESLERKVVIALIDVRAYNNIAEFFTFFIKFLKKWLLKGNSNKEFRKHGVICNRRKFEPRISHKLSLFKMTGFTQNGNSAQNLRFRGRILIRCCKYSWQKQSK